MSAHCTTCGESPDRLYACELDGDFCCWECKEQHTVNDHSPDWSLAWERGVDEEIED